MKRTLSILAVLVVAGLVYGPAGAQTSLSLYEQEGTGTDGYGPINAAGQNTAADANTTNWKYQYGGGTYSAVYGSAGWVVNSEVTTGDSTIDIECDIELYYAESFTNNKVYVHIGDPFNATAADKTIYVNGTYTSNNGMYIGISFESTGKVEADLVTDANGLTGEITGAMVGTTDAWGRDISPGGAKEAPPFNVKLSLSWDVGHTTYNPPITFGEGSHGTIVETLWWLVDDGNIGSYDLSYKIELLMTPTQPDGNYNFDPAIVASPVL